MNEADPLDLASSVVDGRYAVESVAGYGGTAVVYRARDLRLNHPVALKLVRGLGDLSPEMQRLLVDQLAREADVLATLSQRTSAIIQARDFGVVAREGTVHPYLVLEWLEGETLDAILEREVATHAPPRGLEAAMTLLEPVAHALDLAHHAGVAHRDVKPANIFVTHDGLVKILDFGVAKVVADVFAADGGFTKTGGTFTALTPAYAAPEQFSRSYGPTGPWTDVFALALVLAETATGIPALVGEDLAELAAASTRAERPTLAPLPVSRAVADVFARAVAIKPGDRHVVAGDFWNELRAALGAGSLLDVPTLVPPPPKSRAKPKPSRYVLFALGAAGVTAIAWTAQGAAPCVASRLAPARLDPPKFCPPDMDRDSHALCIDREEVTVADYRACSDRGDCRRADTAETFCRFANPDENAKLSINCLDPLRAAEYCHARGKRLAGVEVAYDGGFRCLR